MAERLKNRVIFWITSMVFFLITTNFLIVPTKIFAEQRGPVTDDGLELKNPLGNKDIIDIINSILNYLIYISVPILAFMILWGGFQILWARDDPEKVKNGRKTIQWEAIGFAVILISKGVAFILLTILKG